MKAFLALLAIPSAALADPGPPHPNETCSFFPMEVRMALPPDHPCYIPPPPPPVPCENPSGECVDAPI